MVKASKFHVRIRRKAHCNGVYNKPLAYTNISVSIILEPQRGSIKIMDQFSSASLRHNNLVALLTANCLIRFSLNIPSMLLVQCLMYGWVPYVNTIAVLTHYTLTVKAVNQTVNFGFFLSPAPTSPQLPFYYRLLRCFIVYKELAPSFGALQCTNPRYIPSIQNLTSSINQ